jgi:hypothetical protein
MIPGGKTIHDMVLDESGPVKVPDSDGRVFVNGNADSAGSTPGTEEVAAVGDATYVSEWTDDLKAGERKI